MKKTQHDPFIQRALEHWLDSVNELGYQPLFCEWLITKKHILKYSIKNNSFEFGKDVVSINPEGEPCGYQLKGGDITLERWRREVKPEIEVLIDCAIEHPDIDKEKPHISYLVTNGELDDSVRLEIIQYNAGKWKKTPLKIYRRGDLLNGFLGMSEGILPKDAMAYKNLIDLLFENGLGIPDSKKIYSFLFDILNINRESLSKAQRKRDISAAILYGTMMVGPYKKEENYSGAVNIMTILLGLIFFLVDKYNLDDQYWIDSFKIVWGEILSNAKKVEQEIETVGFDKSFTSALDNNLNPFRKHAAISVIFPLKLAQLIKKNLEWKSLFSDFKKYEGSVALWGESSFIQIIILYFLFKHSENIGIADDLVKNAVVTLIDKNSSLNKEAEPYLSPYFDLNAYIKYGLGYLNEDIKLEDYKGSSYLAKPLLNILVRNNDRKFISENWKKITFLQLEEFRPAEPNGYYVWRNECEGENVTILPKYQQSWKELVQEAEKANGSKLPKTLRRFPEFLPFFLSVFTHRTDSETIGFIYEVLNKNCK